jgi:hypothetical protein
MVTPVYAGPPVNVRFTDPVVTGQLLIAAKAVIDVKTRTIGVLREVQNPIFVANLIIIHPL